MTVTFTTSDNNYGVAQLIVDAIPGKGNYTTIASALSSAVSGQTIFIRPGTYTENLTLVAGVNLTAFGSDSSFNGTGVVIIKGNCTLSTAGSVTISGIQLQTNLAALLTVSGSVASIVNLDNCYLNCTNNTGISFTSSSPSSQINLNSCNGDLGTTGIAIFAHSGVGFLRILNSYITNSGNSTAASTLSGSGNIFMSACRVFNPITTSSTSGFVSVASTINAGNLTALNCGGHGNNNVMATNFVSSSSSAISISSGVTLKIYSCQVDSSNTNAITGTGIINYSCLSFGDTSSTIDSALTQNGGTIQGSRNTAPPAGFVGEQIRSFVNAASPVSISNNTATNITSINLTTGIWDVSGIITFDGATTGTTLSISISTTSATQGSSGDARVVFPFLSQASSVMGLTLPSLRFTFSTTTTVYLVAFSVYSAGAQVGYGRISATRVG